MRRGWRLVVKVPFAPKRGSDAWLFRMALCDRLKLHRIAWDLSGGLDQPVQICVATEDYCAAKSICDAVKESFPDGVTDGVTP